MNAKFAHTFFRWQGIMCILAGVVNLLLWPASINRDKDRYSEHIVTFIERSDFISYVVLEMWGVYILIAALGAPLIWLIYKTKNMNGMYSSSISLVYLVCALWMSFSAMSVLTTLEKQI